MKLLRTLYIFSIFSFCQLIAETAIVKNVDDESLRHIFQQASRCFDEKRFDDAIAYYENALFDYKPTHKLYYNLGICYIQIHKMQDAIDAFKKAIKLDKRYAPAYLNLGALYEKRNETHEALMVYYQALENTEPTHELYLRIGNIYKSSNKLEEAARYYKKAHELKPEHMQTIMSLANTLTILNNCDDALVLYKKALDLNPTYTTAMHNAAYVLKKRGYLAQAIVMYEKALQQKPSYALAHFNLGLAYLEKGDFKRGLEEHEWRWKAYQEDAPSIGKPIWDGSSLQNKRIFVYAEQGLGDTLQFVRYLRVLKEQGAYIIFKTQRPLADLMRSIPYIDELVLSYDRSIVADYEIALMSIPYICKTRVNSIPAPIPYLYAEDSLISLWNEKLPKEAHFKIGICWHGNGNYQTESLRRAVAEKSIPLSHLIRLAEIPGVHLYSLQRVDGVDEIENIPSCSLHVFDEQFDKEHGRFMDTAAVMKNLDLIITVDTSIAHLAGGLGVPVFLMLPHNADWRWLRNRQDTPWYPTMMLFRQSEPGSWDSVITEIANILHECVRKKCADHFSSMRCK